MLAVPLLMCYLLTGSCRALNCSSSLEDLYPQWDGAPFTCDGRCGEEFKPQPCSCDWRCPVYGDCCHDMDTVCLTMDNHSLTTDSQNMATTSWARDGGHRLTENLGVNHTSSSLVRPKAGSATCDFGQVRLISACPRPLVLPEGPVVYGGRRIFGSELARQCHTPWYEASGMDVLQVMPVTDPRSGHHFLNIYCFLCHGGDAQHTLPWAMGFIWNMHDVVRGPTPSTLYELMATAANLGIPSVAVPPDRVQPRHCADPDKLGEVSCECPELLQQCQQQPEAYVMANYQLYRNPQCLRCAFVKAGIGPGVVTAVVEEDLQPSTSSFDYLVTVAWASPPALSDNATLTISYQQKPLRTLFPWELMECHWNVAGVEDPPDTGVASVRTMDAFEDAGWHEEIRTHEEDEKEYSDFEGLQSRGPERKQTMFSEGNDQIEDEDMVCRQVVCTAGMSKVDGVCRVDVHSLLINMRMMCVEPQELHHEATFLAQTMGPKSRIQRGNEAARKGLRNDLRERLHHLAAEVIVSVLSIFLDTERCFWNISASAVFPRSSKALTTETVATAMYGATTTALSDQLTNATQGIFVCVKVHPPSTEVAMEDVKGSCTFSTMIWPKEDNDSSGAGLGILVSMNLLCVSLAAALLFCRF